MIIGWRKIMNDVYKYKKKPVEIEAIKFTRDSYNEVTDFVGDKIVIHTERCPNGKMWAEIDTLEGKMLANIGDYIIKGIKGEFYPCKPDVFEATYEMVQINKGN